MSKKLVGIITLPGNFNYGNRLQCFAMTRAIQRTGCNPVVLEREVQFPWYRRSYYSLRAYVSKILGGGNSVPPEKMQSPERAAAFCRFASCIPTIRLQGTGLSDLGAYDRILVGSDQVWNPDQIRHQEKWYFAKTVASEKRMAVAASIGVDSLSGHRVAARLADGIKGFSRVAVRENRGAELIKEILGRDVEVICDPTLSLTAEEWREIADGRCTPSGAYVFTYLLGGVSSEAADVLERVTDRGRIPVVPLTDRQKPGEPDAGPSEFIHLVDHAAHVVTDSFHAAAFSSILQTPLTIVHREGGASMFSRLEQLSQMLGIEEKIYGTPEYDPSLAGDYSGVSEFIAFERSRFLEYMKGCLDD